MDSKKRTLPVKYRLLLATLGLLGTSIILLITSRWGAGLSPDSVTYIATGRSLSNGMGFATPYGGPAVYWPPLYPALLAVVDCAFGVDPLFSARIVGAILFGLEVYLSGLLFFRYLSSSAATALLGTTSVLVASCQAQVSLMAWSEPLFICLTLLCLIYVELYLATGNTSSLFLLSFSVALACLTRYVGVTLVMTGVVSILLCRRDGLKTRVKHLLLFIFISGLPIGIWVGRNYLVSGTLFGERGRSMYTLFQDLTFAFDTFLSWYFPGRISDHRSILVLLSATIGFVAGVAVRDNWSKVKASIFGIEAVLLMVLVYIGFVTMSSTRIPIDRMDMERYLSVVFVPTALLLMYFALVISRVLAERFSRKLVNLLFISTVSVWMVCSARVTFWLVMDYMAQGGWGYNSGLWRDSGTIRYLVEHPDLGLQCAVYSNDPPGAYILANFVARTSPVKGGYNSPETGNDVSSLRGCWPEEGEACLVWFDRVKWSHLYGIDQLQTVADMEVVIRLEDGVVWSVRRK